jgi:hypothetical protein
MDSEPGVRESIAPSAQVAAACDSPGPSPVRIRRATVAIIGAGPAALTLAARLVEPASDCSGGYALGMGSDLRDTYMRIASSGVAAAREGEPSPSSWLSVVDPAVGWLASWHAAMALLRVRYLRSHVDVHPDPRGSRTLLRFLDGLLPLRIATPPSLVAAAAADNGGGAAPASATACVTDHARTGRGDAAVSTGIAASTNAGSCVRASGPLPTDLFDIPTGLEGHIHTGESALDGGDSTEAIEARGAAVTGHLLAMEFFGRGREFAGPFLLPSIDGFRAHADALVARYNLRDTLVRGAVVAVERLAPAAAADPDAAASGAPRYCVRLADGSEVHATSVVVALGSGAPRWPEWAADARAAFPEAPEASLAHASEVESIMAAMAGLRGRNVCVVGGGLSAVQLALAAVAHGAAHVVLLARRRLRVRQFDLPLSWMAWGRRPAQLRSFWAMQSPADRIAAAGAARGGGSVTPEAARDLLAAMRAGRIDLRVGDASEVTAACWMPAGGYDAAAHLPDAGDDARPRGAWELWRADGGVVAADVHHLWLATGYTQGIPVGADNSSHAGDEGNHPSVGAATSSTLLKQLQATFGGLLVPTSSRGIALPVLTPSLRWSPTEDIFVVGALAAVQLGPDAGNLAGARAASVRVAACLRPTLPGNVAAAGSAASCARAAWHSHAESELRSALLANDAALAQLQQQYVQLAATRDDERTNAAAFTRLPFRVTLTRSREPILHYAPEATVFKA